MIGWYIVIAIVVVLFVGWIIWRIFFSGNRDDHRKTFSSTSTSLASINQFKGQSGEAYVEERLCQALDENQITYHLYTDLYLPNNCERYSKISQIDHLLVTQKNIYVIEDKWYFLTFHNQLRGNLTENQLYLYNPETDSQKPVSNPFKQNHNHVLTTTNFFNSANIPTSDIKSVVIMKTNDYNKTNANDLSVESYCFYTVESFLDEMLKIELEPLTSEEVVENNFSGELINLLDDIVSQKEYFRNEHKSNNNY